MKAYKRTKLSKLGAERLLWYIVIGRCKVAKLKVNMFFQFDCKQTSKSASDGDWRHSFYVDTMNEQHNTFGSSHTPNLKHKCLMFWVTFLVKWNGAFYTKNVIIISNGLASVCVSPFTKDQESHKNFSGNKVLDTYTLQFNIWQSLAYAMIT